MRMHGCVRPLLMGLIFALFTATNARAHTGEYLRSLALHPTDPNVFVLRYQGAFGGLLFSHDGGQSLRVLPGLTIYPYELPGAPPMLMASDGKLQLALDHELRIDDGTGCTLDHAETGFDKAEIAALAPHPSKPQTTFMLSMAILRGNSAPSHAGLWQRDVRGMTPIGANDPGAEGINLLPFRPTSLKVIARAASVQGLRFLEGGVSADTTTTPPTYTPLLRVSDDLGATWTAYPVAARGVEGDPKLLVVSPGEPFRALVALERGLGDADNDAREPFDPIYLTKDGAQSFLPYLDQIQVLGEAVLLPSGRVLLGDRGLPGGLWSAANIESAPFRVHDARVHCLGYQAQSDQLFMCTRHEFGLYDVESNKFCSMFRMADARGFVACPAAPLERNPKAINQICGGWCWALHYASAPLCSTFEPSKGQLCGASALAYDQDAGYVPPPGLDAAPRCQGFPGVVDAGVGVVDAGSDAGADPADAADAADDASANADVDAGEAEGDDENEDDEGEADAAEEPEPDAGPPAKRRRGGCHCELAGSDRTGSLAWPALALTLTLVYALRSRRARATARRRRASS